MELKTLKDLNQWKIVCKDCRTPAMRHVIEREIIKAEAIKWVKKWRKEINEEPEINCDMDKILKLPGKIEATMELNNITDEDLK